MFSHSKYLHWQRNTVSRATCSSRATGGRVWFRSLSLPLLHTINTFLTCMWLPDDIISIIRRIDAGSLLLAVQSLLPINTGYIIYNTVDRENTVVILAAVSEFRRGCWPPIRVKECASHNYYTTLKIMQEKSLTIKFLPQTERKTR